MLVPKHERERSCRRHPSRRHEGQRQAVEAVALARGRRAVVEDVAEMAAAAPAVDLGARHDQRIVGLGADRIGQGGSEARPAGAAVVFGLRRIDGEVAAGAMIETGALFVEQRAGERAFGILAPQDEVRAPVELGLPLRIGHSDLEALAGGLRLRAEIAEAGQGQGHGGGTGQKEVASGEHGFCLSIVAGAGLRNPPRDR